MNLLLSFSNFRNWLTYWTTQHPDFRHDPNTNIRIFFGNSSYMDIGDLLRQQNGMDSSPCIIYDTDIHRDPLQNGRVIQKVHTFYICALTDEQINGEQIALCKEYLEKLADDLIGAFSASKQAGNHCLRHINLPPSVHSTTPFLNGWYGVRMVAYEELSYPCYDASLYQA